MNDKKRRLQELGEVLKDVSFLSFKRSFSKFKNMNLHPGQFLGLKIIGDKPGITLKEIVEITNREKATATKSIQRLEAAELIQREIDEKDKRIFHLHLTPKGKQLYQELKNTHEEEMNVVSDIITNEELDIMLNIAKKLKKGLEGENK